MKNIIIRLPKGTPWLDYSTLSMLQRCPRSYYWRVIQGVTTAEDGPALINGSAYHEAKAVYLQCMIDGKPHNEAKKEALLACAPIMQKIQYPDAKRNVTVAIDTLNYYFDYWDGAKSANNYTPIEVEVGFAIDLINFFYVGRIDSVEKCAFGEVVMETKTTTIVGSRWDFRTDPNLQIDGYVAARYITTGKMPYGGVLDVIPIHDKKNLDPFRLLAPRSEMNIEHWMEEVQEWWITLSRYRDCGIFPKHTEMCNPLVGWSCDYRLLCKKYPQPHHCSNIDLPGEYKVEFWAPFEFEIEEVEEVNK